MKKLLVALHDFDYSEYTAEEWEIIDTKKIPHRAIRTILSKIRAHKYDQLLVGSKNWDQQFKPFYARALAFLARAKSKKIIDNQGRTIPIQFFRHAILFAFEIIASQIILLRTQVLIKKLKSHSPISAPSLTATTTIAAAPTATPPAPQPKIHYFRTDYTFHTPAGGSVGHIAGVANAFHRTGHPIEIFTMERPAEIDPEIKITTIPPNKFYNNISDLREIAYNYKFNSQIPFDTTKSSTNFIYQRYSAFNFSGVYLSQKHRVPLILEFNGSEAWIAKNWGTPFAQQSLAEKIELLNLQLATLIVVVSDAMKEQVMAQGIPAEKILSHPNCIDPQKFHPKIDPNPIRKKLNLEDKTVVGFIGTFGPWHGIDLLAKAIKPAITKNPNLHFLLIGDGALLPEVKKIIAENQVESHVTLTGLIPQNEAPDYLAACDILTSPTMPNSDGTKFFGSPTKLFEYMGMGKPIIASNIDQIGQILTHNENALLTKPGDLDSLTEAILTLSTSPELRAKLGQAAHQEATNKYTWQKNIEAVLKKLH